MISALNTLNLITPTGQPTEALRNLVYSEGKERQSQLNHLLRNSFPFLFESGFKIETDTAKHFEEQFTKVGIAQETARKCKAFFLAAAKDAGIEPSSYILKGARGGKRERKPKANNVNPSVTPAGAAPTPPVTEQKTNAIAQALLDKFPTFDPAWSDEVKTKWFESFERLMGMTEKRN
jgi:hypothetical protein